MDFIIGDWVKLIDNPSDDQDRWGGNSSHKLLVPNSIYTVEDIEPHSWHTKIKLKEINGYFNSVIFQKIRKSNKSFYITNHRKKEEEVSSDDFYSTHPDSIKLFLDTFLSKYKIDLAWEPACGTGNISEVLKEYGIKVHSTDLVDRGYGDAFFDFLGPQLISPQVDTIITNPPFKNAERFIRRSISLKPKRFVIMYLKLTFLESKKRYNLFKEFPPAEVYIHSSRQGCDPHGKKDFSNGGAVCFAWYVWITDKPQHSTQLFWLPPNS